MNDELEDNHSLF